MFLLKNLLELLSAVISILDRFFDRTGDMLGDLWDAFPSPFKMGGVLVGYFTGLPGLIVEGFALSYLDLFAVSLEKPTAVKQDAAIGLPWTHVMTPANAVRYVAFSIAQTLRFVTLTRDASLLDVVAAWLGRWFYRMLKRFELLLKLLNLSREGDFIAFFRSIFASRAGGAVVIAVASLLAFMLILSTALTCMCAFAGSIIEPKGWERFVLFSQHKREKVKVKISRRVGGVAP